MTQISPFQRVKAFVSSPQLKVANYTDLYPVYEDIHAISQKVANAREPLGERVGAVWRRFLESTHGRPVLRQNDGTSIDLDLRREFQWLNGRKGSNGYTWKELNPGDLPLFTKVSQAVDAMTREGLQQVNRECIPYALGLARYRTFFLEDNASGEIVAFITYRDQEVEVEGRVVKVRYLSNLARRASAVGLRAMASMAEEVRKHPHRQGGDPELTLLHVLCSSERAQALYKRHFGMKVVERIPHYYGPDRDAFFMADHELTPALKDAVMVQPDQQVDSEMRAFQNLMSAQLSFDPWERNRQIQALFCEQEIVPRSWDKFTDMDALEEVATALETPVES